MKIAFSIFVLSVYFAVTLGITVTLHFCGGTLTSVQVLTGSSKNDACSCDNESSADGCCKTEVKSIHFNDDQLDVQAVQCSSPISGAVAWVNQPVAEMVAVSPLQQIAPTGSPPLAVPTYILHSTLLI